MRQATPGYNIIQSQITQETVDKALIKTMIKDPDQYERTKEIVDKYNISELQTPIWLNEQLLQSQFKFKLIQAKQMVKHFLDQQNKQSQVKSKVYKIPSAPFTKPHSSDKVIILIGQAASGKTTLVQFLFNYLKNFSQLDPIPKIESLMSGNHNLYIIQLPTYPKLYIYEIQGLGKDVKLDSIILKEMQSIICSLEFIHLICFVFQANNVKLSDNQNYLMSSVFSYLPSQYKDNIIAFLTFSDGEIPQIVQNLQMDYCIWKQCIQKSEPWYFTVNCQTLYSLDKSNQITELLFKKTQQSLSQFLCKLIMINSISTSYQKYLKQLQQDVENKQLKIDYLIEKQNPQYINDIISQIQEMDSLMSYIKPLVLNIHFGYNDYLDHHISIESSKPDSSKMRYLNCLQQAKQYQINQFMMANTSSYNLMSPAKSITNLNAKSQNEVKLVYLTLSGVNYTQTDQVNEFLNECGYQYVHKKYQEFKSQEIQAIEADIIILNDDEFPSFLRNTQDQIINASKILLATRIYLKKGFQIVIVNPEISLKDENKKKIKDKIESLNYNIPPSSREISLPKIMPQKMTQNRVIQNIQENNQQVTVTQGKQSSTPCKSNQSEKPGYPIVQQTIQLYLLTSHMNYDIIKALKDSLIYIQQRREENLISIGDKLLEVILDNQDNQVNEQSSCGMHLASSGEVQYLISFKIVIDQVSQSNQLQLKVINKQETEFNLRVNFTLNSNIESIMSKSSGIEPARNQYLTYKILCLGYASLSDLKNLSKAIEFKLTQNEDGRIQFLHKNISYQQEQDEVIELYCKYQLEFKCIIYLPYLVMQEQSKLYNWMLDYKIPYVLITYSFNRDRFQNSERQVIYLKPQQSYEVEDINQNIKDYLLKTKKTKNYN